jgi:tetratricopeptide (TPR) repeat protein
MVTRVKKSLWQQLTAHKSPVRARVKKTAKPEDLPSSDFRLFAQALVILVATAVVFAPTLHAPFYSDDVMYILNNPLLTAPDRLWKAWFEPGSFIEYYPIEQSAQYFQWLLFGTDPFGYHICNIALHGINALLVWFFLSKLGLRFAWLGGLIYAVYPLFVETVGYIAELKNTLSLAPFLLSMCFYIDYEKKREMSAYLLSLGLFFVAMLCKISMMFFPFVILLYAWYLHGRISRADLQRCAPFLVISVVLGLVCLQSGRIYDANIHSVPPGPIHIGSFLSRVELIGLIFSFYFSHALLPVIPMAYYPLWRIHPISFWAFLPWPVFGFVMWFLWNKRNTWGRPAILGLGAFLLFLIPTLGIFTISYMSLTWVVDHLLYIPMIFLLAVVLAGAEGIYRLLPNHLRAWSIAIPAAIVLLLAAETHWYARIFSDQEKLFADNLKHNANSWFVHYSLGCAMLKEGKMAPGIEELEISLQANPDFFMPHLYLGTCLLQQGKVAEAEVHFRHSIRINPRGSYVAYSGLGTALMLEGHPADAIGVFQKELALAPGDPKGYNGLGSAYLQLGHTGEAITEFRNALQYDPNDTFARESLNRLKAN